MARYHGRKGMVYISTSSSTNASKVASLSSWELNMATDKVETTSFGDANKTYVQGLKDLSGSFSGFFDDSDTNVFTAADSSSGCKIYLYPSEDAKSIYFYGPAWLDASISTGVGAAITVQANFSANGSWGQKLS